MLATWYFFGILDRIIFADEPIEIGFTFAPVYFEFWLLKM